MITIIRDKVTKFLKETTDAEAVRIIMVDKAEAGWVVEAEVAEKNQYLASINPVYRIFEKVRYIVKLDTGLDVVSYKRLKGSEEELEGSIYVL